MDALTSLRVFREVVDAGSFVKAVNGSTYRRR